MAQVAVQDKARLLEAIEVASLAVAGQGSDNKVLAKSYLQYYFPLAKINDADITINKINCEDNDACKGQDRRFLNIKLALVSPSQLGSQVMMRLLVLDLTIKYMMAR
ncbi:hypothetical protein ACT691_18260 [Vibrio metschnikovii]